MLVQRHIDHLLGQTEGSEENHCDMYNITFIMKTSSEKHTFEALFIQLFLGIFKFFFKQSVTKTKRINKINNKIDDVV